MKHPDIIRISNEDFEKYRDIKLLSILKNWKIQVKIPKCGYINIFINLN